MFSRVIVAANRTSGERSGPIAVMVKSAGSYSGTSGNGVGETPGTDRSPRGRNRWARCIRHHGFAGRIRNTGCNEHDTHNDHCCKHQQNADGQFLLQITKYTPDILLKDMLFFREV